jgi:hypothetical protein
MHAHLRQVPVLLAAGILCGLSVSGTHAAAIFAGARPGIASGGPCELSSSQQTAVANCENSNGSLSLGAAADAGHVGAGGVATSYTSRGSLAYFYGTASASYQSSEYIFSAIDGEDGFIDVSLNLSLSGSGLASKNASWDVRALARVNGATLLNLFTTQAGEEEPLTAFDAGRFAGRRLVTDSFPVLTGQAVTIILSIAVDVGSFGLASLGAPGHAEAHYENSLDFPIGVDVFNLPEGYTVNNPEAYIFNNRFIPPNETPLPSAFGLFGIGLGALGLLGWRRRKQRAA